ncbi:hypothetical protein [Kyrpidia spormannii]|nr:hypothetical protein [Kyrpidia spormannii]
MSKGRLAKALGFLGVESLEQNSFEIAHDDSKTWYITILPEGDYALWNNKETDPNLVMYFDTPDEVIEYLHRWKKENDPMDHLIIESMYKK